MNDTERRRKLAEEADKRHEDAFRDFQESEDFKRAMQEADELVITMMAGIRVHG